MLADIGSSMAPLYLGWIYQNGKLVKQDSSMAEYWLKLSLERGEIIAAYYLGHHYLRLERNSDAVSAFEQGTKNGSVASKYCLAMAILDGKGVTTDLDKARQLLGESSEGGHVFATRQLASMYLSGSFGAVGRLFGIALWIKAVITGTYFAIKMPEDERLRA